MEAVAADDSRANVGSATASLIYVAPVSGPGTTLKQVGVKPFPAVQNRVEAEPLRHELACALAHCGSFLYRKKHHSGHELTERGGIARRAQPAGLPIDNNLRSAGNAGSHGG